MIPLLIQNHMRHEHNGSARERSVLCSPGDSLCYIKAISNDNNNLKKKKKKKKEKRKEEVKDRRVRTALQDALGTEPLEIPIFSLGVK